MSAAPNAGLFADPKVHKVLRKLDLQQSNFGNRVGIYDADGDHVVSVPRDISAPMLELLLGHGAHMFARGKRAGVYETQARIRDALGLQAQESGNDAK